MSNANRIPIRMMGGYGQRIRTTDSARRSRDAILSAVTPAESAANAKRVAGLSGLNLGRVWVGDLTEKLDALKADPTKFADALGAAMTALTDYSLGNSLGSTETAPGPSGSLAFGGGMKVDPTTSEGAAAEVKINRSIGDAMNARNRAFYGQKPIG